MTDQYSFEAKALLDSAAIFLLERDETGRPVSVIVVHRDGSSHKLFDVDIKDWGNEDALEASVDIMNICLDAFSVFNSF